MAIFFVKVEVDALIVFELVVGEYLVAFELVEALQDVSETENCAPQSDKLLLGFFAEDGLVEREGFQHFHN